MLTDASRLYGIGFALIQKSQDGNIISLIQCGSCSLSEIQQRYATVELECLAYTTASRKLELLLDLQSKNYSAITATNIHDQLAQTERVEDILAALAEWLKVNRHPKRD